MGTPSGCHNLGKKGSVRKVMGAIWTETVSLRASNECNSSFN